MIFRHEDEKMCLLQLGWKFSIPEEIIFYIYRKKKMEGEKLIDEVRIFNLRNIWENCVDSNPELLEKFTVKDKIEEIIKEVPHGKPSIRRTLKEAILNQIQIIGEPTYLMKKNEDKRWERCPLRWKLEYLRKNFWNTESEYDFNNYQEWKETINEKSWRICIDEQGHPHSL
jgi:hypothetical protein